MTRKEALAEAQRRWGRDGKVRQRLSGASRFRFQVGVGGNPPYPVLNPSRFFVINGSGDSWEAAFADADERKRARLDRLATYTQGNIP